MKTFTLTKTKLAGEYKERPVSKDPENGGACKGCAFKGHAAACKAADPCSGIIWVPRYQTN